MRHSLWLLLAAILSLPAQAATECRDIHDRDLRRMCNALERGDSGDCGDIDSRDLRRYCGALLAPGTALRLRRHPRRRHAPPVPRRS
ncbi:hypothetical protein ACLXBB_24510, partial [Pseudomonas aeruginosa]